MTGYPTLKAGAPDALEAYDGGRDFESMRTFAATLGPVCSLARLDLCSTEQRGIFERFLTMEPEKLRANVAALEKKKARVVSKFEREEAKLAKQREKNAAKKERKLAQIATVGGLRSMRAVEAQRNKTRDAEEYARRAKSGTLTWEERAEAELAAMEDGDAREL